MKVSPRPIRQDLVDKLTDHTIGNLKFLTIDMQDRLSDTLKEGYRLGEGITDLRDRLVEVLDVEKGEAARDARTMTNEVYNQAHMQRYKEAGVPGVQFSAAKGENTCPVCRDLNGTVWAIDDPDIVRPPVHPSCKCRLLAYLDALPDDAGQVDSEVMDYYKSFRKKYWNVPAYA